MPAAMIKSLSDKTGKSEKEIERLWNKAKEIVSKQYPEVSKSSDNYWKLVTGITQKMSGLEESSGIPQKYKFKTFVTESIYKYKHEGIIPSDIKKFIDDNNLKLSKDSRGDYIATLSGKKDPIFKYDREELELYTDFTILDFKRKRIESLTK